eukprot:CAMPEP_0115000336 /NCGR_PEP_ID=MMETSP0216-20121206/16697_1 /TAXON_ID=223996 /ORGANISM="Protocruzia adherens, Strain Boccale" /LENGTH=610 /DNA_ID=CAMNT_0002365415 /DNA_START=194 /DNA_END=2023 /DNA_ORIENTATION=+
MSKVAEVMKVDNFSGQQSGTVMEALIAAEKLTPCVRGFRVLREDEYEEYLVEVAARNKSDTERIDKEDIASFQEFLLSKKFLADERYYHSFRLSICLYYFLAHLLFYFLGPFSYPILLLTHGKYRIYNMAFWGNSKNFFSQLGNWFIFAVPTVYYLMYPDSGIFPTEIQALMLNIVFRSFIISVRYGYASETLLYTHSRIKKTFAVIGKDLALFGWKEIPVRTIEKELEVAILRLKIDQPYFKFSFASPLKDPRYLRLLESTYEERQNIDDVRDFTEKLAQPKRRLKKVWTQVTKKPPRGSTSLLINGATSQESELFPGKHLAREIFLLSKAKQSNMNYFTIHIFIILLIPTFFRWAVGIAPFGENLWEVPIFLLLLAASTKYNWLNLLFINLAYVDSSRRLFLMRSLSSLISIHKDFTFQFLHAAPMIDIFDTKCLNNWYNMRTLFMDVGQRYADKIYLYFSVVILGYLVMAMWFVFLLLGFVSLDSLDVNLQAILIGNLLLLIFIYIGLVLYNGASINDHFMIHRDLLTKNKTHYAAIEENAEDLKPNLNYVNPLLTLAAKKSISLGSTEKLKANFEPLYRTTDRIYEKLMNDELKNPYKILGAKVNW